MPVLVMLRPRLQVEPGKAAEHTERHGGSQELEVERALRGWAPTACHPGGQGSCLQHAERSHAEPRRNHCITYSCNSGLAWASTTQASRGQALLGCQAMYAVKILATKENATIWCSFKTNKQKRIKSQNQQHFPGLHFWNIPSAFSDLLLANSAPVSSFLFPSLHARW